MLHYSHMTCTSCSRVVPDHLWILEYLAMWVNETYRILLDNEKTYRDQIMQCMYHKLMYKAIYVSIYFSVREQEH